MASGGQGEVHIHFAGDTVLGHWQAQEPDLERHIMGDRFAAW
jgi:hypothetical protein